MHSANVRQNADLLKLLNSYSPDARAKALEATVSESGRQLHTSKLSAIESPPPDGSELPIPVEELLFTAKGFRSNISEKLRSYEVCLQIIVLLKNLSRKKSLFFSFFAKICKKTAFCCYSKLLLQVRFSIA